MITPDDAGYDQARTVFYGGFHQRRPAVIIRAADASDVARGVELARGTGLPLAVRSGGHSPAGHGVCDGGIVLDLSAMKALDIDLDARTAWAQTELTAGEYTTAAGAHGLATGFGDTGSVGIGGITLSGGISYLVRKHGLTIDDLLAAEVVAADGRLLRADADSHPDLFWALRGGGGNFGVATRLQFRLHPLATIVGGILLLPATPEVIAGFVAEAEAAPESCRPFRGRPAPGRPGRLRRLPGRGGPGQGPRGLPRGRPGSGWRRSRPATTPPTCSGSTTTFPPVTDGQEQLGHRWPCASCWPPRPHRGACCWTIARPRIPRMNLKDVLHKVATRIHRVVFRASKGRLLGTVVGLPVAKLVTIGRSSGNPRSTMLAVPIVQGNRLVLVASFGGDDRDPAWYRILNANPRVRVTFAGSTRTMIARTASEQERARLWPQITARYQGYGRYQQRTKRPIPAAILQPRAPAKSRSALNVRTCLSWHPAPGLDPRGRVAPTTT